MKASLDKVAIYVLLNFQVYGGKTYILKLISQLLI
jgi:hypothetical protein